jgi:hypothetical protein
VWYFRYNKDLNTRHHPKPRLFQVYLWNGLLPFENRTKKLNGPPSGWPVPAMLENQTSLVFRQSLYVVQISLLFLILNFNYCTRLGHYKVQLFDPRTNGFAPSSPGTHFSLYYLFTSLQDTVLFNVRQLHHHLIRSCFDYHAI